MKNKNDLPVELRRLVHASVALLGDVIRAELGAASYRRIERIRKRMAGLRGTSSDRAHRCLAEVYDELLSLSPAERMGIAHSYGLMLEMMNACENAYRTHRLATRPVPGFRKRPEAIVYVLTAHPTEARSPDNIMVFNAIHDVLRSALSRGFEREQERLRHLIEVAWSLSTARRHKPTVEDEAEHIYSILLRPETLAVLLEASDEIAPVFVRTWVGGDKDGHPGVDERVMTRSLGASRLRTAAFARARLLDVESTLTLVGQRELRARCQRMRRQLETLSRLRTGDGERVRRFRRELRALSDGYLARIGALHPALRQLHRLLRLFPALVVPLELRESSDIIVEAAAGRPAAITRMLVRLGALARGGEPGWYARGFIISMAGSAEHVEAAGRLMRRGLKGLKIPIIPLFEQREALVHSSRIVSEILERPALREAARKAWGGKFEVMLGYSDSAKEVGVLASRLEIADAVHRLDRLCRARGLQPVFFHGSGGSVDRGGGSVQEQTAWWPRSALALYKATIQGEMVERSFASPEIARGQLERIAERFSEGGAPVRGSSSGVERFADLVRAQYQSRIARPEFLEVVQRATAYRYLSALKIGSRPSKRGAVSSVSALRAIPWVLCWTQTRVLFPTWWGVGTAWRGLDESGRRALRRAFADDPLFRSYVKLLGFTLAKVELPVWRMYLEHSGLETDLVERTLADFEKELRGAEAFVRALSGSRDLVWFRPWLGTSIRLRAPMIHPLNLLQIITLKERDAALTRETVTGIASGMMTTG